MMKAWDHTAPVLAMFYNANKKPEAPERLANFFHPYSKTARNRKPAEPTATIVDFKEMFFPGQGPAPIFKTGKTP